MTDFWGFLKDHVPWLAPIVVFGVVVFVHELGHFLAAKATGVYAPRFSIGFGPALWHKRWGETEYRIALLPLGGYVRMASRDDDMAILEGGGESPPAVEEHGPEWDPNAMRPFGPKDIPPNRWFESKPLPARLLIMLAGITMNFVLAFVCLTGVFAYYGRPGMPNAVVDSVVTNGAAAQAGVLRGDSLIAIDGHAIRNAQDAQDKLRPSPGVALSITVVRKSGEQVVTITPVAVADTDPETHAIRTIGRIGVLFRPAPRQPMPIGQAMAEGFEGTALGAKLVVRSVADLVTGKLSLKSLSGPVRIAQESVRAARTGFDYFLGLIAIISVNVAVFNLLPIPILDGGQILFNVLESIRGTPFSLRTRELIVRTGLLAIALLVVLVMYNDRCVLPFLRC